MKFKIILIASLIFTCNNICEQKAWNGRYQCLKRCENQEVICYVGDNGWGGSPSCFPNKENQI